MSIKSIFFLELIIQITSELSIGVGQTFDISLDMVKILISVLDVKVMVANSSTNFSISTFGTFNMLSEIITVSADSINIFSKGTDLNGSSGVHILKSSDFFFTVIEMNSSVSNLESTILTNLIHFSNASMSFLGVKVKSLESITLINSLLSLHVDDITKSLDFSKHVSSLCLNKVNISFKLSNLSSKIYNLVTSGIALVTEFSRLEEFLVKNSL